MFNILCIEENDFNALRMLIVIFFIASIISVIKGIPKIRNNLKKRKVDEKAKKDFIVGIILAILSIIFIVIGGIIFANNVDYFMGKNSCGGEVNPILIFIRPIRMVVILIYFGLIIFNIVKWIYCGVKNKERITKQELIKKVIMYFIIVVVVFFIGVFLEAMLELSNEEGSFAQCWCN